MLFRSGSVKPQRLSSSKGQAYRLRRDWSEHLLAAREPRKINSPGPLRHPTTIIPPPVICFSAFSPLNSSHSAPAFAIGMNAWLVAACRSSIRTSNLPPSSSPAGGPIRIKEMEVMGRASGTAGYVEEIGEMRLNLWPFEVCD